MKVYTLMTEAGYVNVSPSKSVPDGVMELSDARLVGYTGQESIKGCISASRVSVSDEAPNTVYLSVNDFNNLLGLSSGGTFLSKIKSFFGVIQ